MEFGSDLKASIECFTLNRGQHIPDSWGCFGVKLVTTGVILLDVSYLDNRG